MRRRREIDGLRAIAVVPVVLYHAGVAGFGGGFVGVDVFFVISGFLITGLLTEEMEAGRFSLASFYERRARRILPALFLVMLACVPFALLWMLPPALKDFSQSLAAASTSTSNVLFWLRSGYFAPAAELKPLLHTWSLGVEEQFYIAYPLFLAFAWRLGRGRLFAVLAALTLASLALCQWAAHSAPEANFFLAPTRAWELLIGALCALLLAGRSEPRGNDLAGGVGLAMVVASVFLFDEETPFPSLYALLPVLGTALVLLCARAGTRTAALLSTRPLVGLGLISYSLYLWHQPLFAFARIRLIDAPSTSIMLALTGLSLVLAVLSWHYVELPFRRRTRPLLPGKRALFRASGVAAAALVLLGVAGDLADGLPGRGSRAYHAVLDAAHDRNDRQTTCLQKPEHYDAEAAFARCSDGVEGSFRVALLGDSHADVYAEPLRDALRAEGIAFVQATADSCPPFPGLVADGKDCRPYFAALIPALKAHHVDTVIIAARWTAYAVNTRFSNGEGGVEVGPMHPFRLDVPSSSSAYSSRMLEVFLDGVRSYLAAGFKVVLVYPTPEAGWNVPERLAKLAFYDGRSDVSLSTDARAYARRNHPVVEAFDSLADENLYRVRPDELLCDRAERGRCVNAIGDRVFYYDDDHLSNAGAALVVPSIVDQVTAIRRDLYTASDTLQPMP